MGNLEDLWVVENDGKRRKAKKSICKQCSAEFLQRIKGKKNFCSRNCSDKSRLNRVEVSCSNCGNIFSKQASKINAPRHGFHFCSRECKDIGQSLKGNCEQIRPSHYGNGCRGYWTKQLIEKDDTACCVDCSETKKYLLVVHHIDSDSSNNNLYNLEIVCWNCHAKRHLKKIEGLWVYDSKALTPRNLINEL